jgi:hypothetical protein
MVGQRNPAYIDEELFHEYLTSAGISYIITLQNGARFSGEIGVCLMDSALLHVSERSMRLSGANRALAMALPAHMTNIFHASDL